MSLKATDYTFGQFGEVVQAFLRLAFPDEPLRPVSELHRVYSQVTTFNGTENLGLLPFANNTARMVSIFPTNSDRVCRKKTVSPRQLYSIPRIGMANVELVYNPPKATMKGL